MSSKFAVLVSVAGILFGAGATATHAESSKSEDEWHFSLAPLFLWGMGINGSTTIGPAAAPLDVKFKDALNNLDAVFTFHFEARKRNLTLLAEYQFVDLSPSSELPNGSKVDVSFKNTMAELGAAYSVAQHGNTELQVLGGARYVEQDLKVNGIPLPPLSSLSNKEAWWDAFVGGRVATQLTDKWRFVGRVDYGFGGSDGTWNLSGLFDYRFQDWGSVFVGYRWMDFDYDSGSGSGKDRYTYDATQQGPLAGLNFYW